MKFLNIVKVPENGYAIVTIKREPVNSMNTQLWQELTDCLNDLENDKNCRGVIYNSGLIKNVFTAGNDLSELHAERSNR